MTKEDFVWVGIRLFGIYLLVLAVTSLPEAIEGYWTSSSIRDAVKMCGGSLPAAVYDQEPAIGLFERLFASAGAASARRFVGSLVRVVLFIPAGLYLCKGGKLVFRIVSAPFTDGTGHEAA